MNPGHRQVMRDFDHRQLDGRSATECAAALDICRAIRVGDKPDLELGDDMLRRIVSMLTKLILRARPAE